MTWSVEFDDRARKELRKLDPAVQREILRYLRERIATTADPCRFGKAYLGERAGLWRYRVGSFRLICSIEEASSTVVVIAVGHRREVYD